MSNIIWNLLSAAIAGFATWFWQKHIHARKRKKRLRELQASADGGEVAICLRVGGNSDPLLDVMEYLRMNRPEIKQVIYYQISSEDTPGKLDSPQIANRIIEDICEGIRAYGKGKLARVHLFPAGMLAYPLIASAMLSNWCPVIVYHKSAGSYVALYEINKDRMNQSHRQFKPLKTWSTHETKLLSAKTQG